MMTPWRSRLAGFVIAGFLAVAVGGCGESQRALLPIPVPNADDLEPSVRAALARAQVEFDRVSAGKPTTAELSDAYGELALTYHAQSLVPPADAAYANARILAPRDKRWPSMTIPTCTCSPEGCRTR